MKRTEKNQRNEGPPTEKFGSDSYDMNVLNKGNFTLRCASVNKSLSLRGSNAHAVERQTDGITRNCAMRNR